MKLHKMNVFPGGGANSVVALLAFAISLAATTAQAETWYLTTTQYYNAGPSIWTNAAGTTAMTAYSADDTYVVRNLGRLRFNPVSTNFNGGAIYFGDLSQSGSARSGRLLLDTVGSLTFPKDVHFDYGNVEIAVYLKDSDSSMRDARIIAERIDVGAPDSDSDMFRLICRGTAASSTAIYDNRRILLDAPLYSSSENVGIRVGGSDDGGHNFTVALVKDCSNYNGKIWVKPNRSASDIAFGEWDTCLMLGDTTISGSVKIFKGSAIEARKGVYSHYTYQSGDAAECTVGTLELAANSVIVVSGDTTTPTNGIIHVRDSLSVTAPVAVNIKYDPRRATTNKVTILTAPASSNLDDSDFVLRFDTFIPASHYSLVVENDGVTKSLVAVFEASLVRQISNYEKESTKEKAIGSFAEGYSSLTNAAAWSDGLVPSAEHAPAHYFSARNLRTLVAQSSDYDFPCLSFTKAGSQLTLFTKSFRVPEFIAFGNPIIWTGQQIESTIVADRFEAVSGIIELGAYCAKTLTIDAEIVGAADFMMSGVSGTSAAKGNYVLTGLNTNFSGNITLAQKEQTSGRWNFNNLFQTLYVEDGRNLGGAKEAFDSKALTIKDMARLAVTNADVTLEAGLNRGLCIEGIGRLYVNEPGSLTVNWPVRVQGTMFKEGSGTLALGGGMTVIGGQSADATNRLFVVTNGYVKALSAGCVDGLTVSLAANAATGLKLDYTTADAELAQFGLKNVATDTPFEGGDINVSIENLTCDAFRSDRGKLGLITVKTTAADYVASKLKVARVPNFDVKVEREDDAETGWTTFSAKLTPRGFILTYR